MKLKDLLKVIYCETKINLWVNETKGNINDKDVGIIPIKKWKELIRVNENVRVYELRNNINNKYIKLTRKDVRIILSKYENYNVFEIVNDNNYLTIKLNESDNK